MGACVWDNSCVRKVNRKICNQISYHQIYQTILCIIIDCFNVYYYNYEWDLESLIYKPHIFIYPLFIFSTALLVHLLVYVIFRY